MELHNSSPCGFLQSQRLSGDTLFQRTDKQR